jgi:hypothetical protein
MTTLSARIASVAGIAVVIAALGTLAMSGTTATSSNSKELRPNATPAAPAFRELTIPAGTRISVRLASSHSSAGSRVEDRVVAALVAPVRIDGIEVLPAGSAVSGVVSSVARPGKVKGRGVIGVRLTAVTAHGERYPLSAAYTRVAPSTKKKDVAKIAFPAVGGAVVGALIGGKKGALIGTAVGGGAGTAVVLTTRGKDAYIGAGSVISVTLRQPVLVRVANDRS